MPSNNGNNYASIFSVRPYAFFTVSPFLMWFFVTADNRVVGRTIGRDGSVKYNYISEAIANGFARITSRIDRLGIMVGIPEKIGEEIDWVI